MWNVRRRDREQNPIDVGSIPRNGFKSIMPERKMAEIYILLQLQLKLFFLCDILFYSMDSRTKFVNWCVYVYRNSWLTRCYQLNNCHTVLGLYCYSYVKLKSFLFFKLRLYLPNNVPYRYLLSRCYLHIFVLLCHKLQQTTIVYSNKYFITVLFYCRFCLNGY